ncbi:MAG: hypothetical protein E7536_04410 [Ruminococcaceae bacterium]|nr:hypothetical protein [Oscillospiraceae bacterium]
MDLINNQDVYDNFVALFTIEIDREQMTSQVVGIWKPSNSPVVLFDEVWNKDFSSRYYLVKSLTYEETRILAKKSAGKPSNISHMFAEIDEHNWEELFKNALKSVDEKYANLTTNWWYRLLTSQDCRDN